MTGPFPRGSAEPRRHVAFLPYPAYGHMMPVLPVVAELVGRGHRVTCFATEEFADRVRATGAELRRYDPPLSSEPPPDVIDADESARAPLKLLKASTAVLPTIEACFADGPPDAVAYDTTLWLTGRLLAARWGRPSVQLSPTFVSNEHFNLSEQHQDFAGQIDPEHPAVVEFANRLRDIVAGSGLPESQQAELFYGREEYTIAFVPRELQWAGDTFDERHVFVGPTTGAGAETGTGTEAGTGTETNAGTGTETSAGAGTETSAGAAWRPPADGRPVLLVSLGTTVNNRPGFFRACVAAFAGLPWHTVLALGNRVSPEELGPLPPHVEAHAWVPLDAVLPHTSVFLCQSGMGSILAALRAAVPMVVVPHHPEQHVNARRLTQLGLARVVRREDADAETLRGAVLDVAGDTALRERVRGMRRHVRAAGGAVRAADAIEQRLNSLDLEVS